jgi:hypothetical protein
MHFEERYEDIFQVLSHAEIAFRLYYLDRIERRKLNYHNIYAKILIYIKIIKLSYYQHKNMIVLYVAYLAIH